MHFVAFERSSVRPEGGSDGGRLHGHTSDRPAVRRCVAHACQRHLNAECRALGRRGAHLDRPVHGGYERAGDCRPEARAFWCRRSFLCAAVQPFEDARELVSRDSASVVAYADEGGRDRRARTGRAPLRRGSRVARGTVRARAPRAGRARARPARSEVVAPRRVAQAAEVVDDAGDAVELVLDHRECVALDPFARRIQAFRRRRPRGTSTHR
jgi:hypothetical protein